MEEHVNDAIAEADGWSRRQAPRTWWPTEPTIVADVTPGMKVAREETFGPLAPVFRFTDEAQAIQMANDAGCGLAAYFYGRDLGRVWRVSEALEYGIVGINSGIISTERSHRSVAEESGFESRRLKYGIGDYRDQAALLMGGIWAAVASHVAERAAFRRGTAPAACYLSAETKHRPIRTDTTARSCT